MINETLNYGILFLVDFWPQHFKKILQNDHFIRLLKEAVRKREFSEKTYDMMRECINFQTLYKGFEEMRKWGSKIN